MRSGEVPVAVLDAVQVFDEKVAPARRALEEGAHFVAGLGVDPSPFGVPGLPVSRGLPFPRGR